MNREIQVPELTDPASQDGLEEALPQRKDVVVAGREVADVRGDLREPQSRVHLPRREESFRDATLIKYLDGPRVKPAGSRSIEVMTGTSFDDDDVDPRQRQLARQHQPGRAASSDHDRMLGHLAATSSTGSALPLDPSTEGLTRIPQLLPS